MKILILANNDVGLYKFRKELILELIKEGHRVTVVIPDGKLISDIKKLGVKVVITNVDRRGINPLKDVVLLIRYLYLIFREKPELVITYTIKPNIYGGICCRILKIPYAENITGLGTAFQKENLIKKIVCALYKISAKRAKVVFFENEENKQIFISSRLIKKEQAYRLNGAGINLDEYPYIEYPDKKGPIRFLFIGRVMKEKGVNELFEAANRIKKEYSDVFFDIVGPMEDEYDLVIKQLEKNGIITYYGYQQDVRPFIAQCSCFILPSWHEGMANTNLECASSGRPLITSNIPGCKEAVIDGVSGLLCIPQNINSLYEMIEKMILMDYDCRKVMGCNGRKHMENIFDKKKVVMKTINQLFD